MNKQITLKLSIHNVMCEKKLIIFIVYVPNQSLFNILMITMGCTVSTLHDVDDKNNNEIIQEITKIRGIIEHFEYVFSHSNQYDIDNYLPVIITCLTACEICINKSIQRIDDNNNKSIILDQCNILLVKIANLNKLNNEAMCFKAIIRIKR